MNYLMILIQVESFRAHLMMEIHKQQICMLGTFRHRCAMFLMCWFTSVIHASLANSAGDIITQCVTLGG